MKRSLDSIVLERLLSSESGRSDADGQIKGRGLFAIRVYLPCYVKCFTTEHLLLDYQMIHRAQLHQQL